MTNVRRSQEAIWKNYSQSATLATGFPDRGDAYVPTARNAGRRDGPSLGKTNNTLGDRTRKRSKCPIRKNASQDTRRLGSWVALIAPEQELFILWLLKTEGEIGRYRLARMVNLSQGVTRGTVSYTHLTLPTNREV